MTDEKIEDICEYAVMRKLRRGEAILCSEGLGIAPQVNAPILSEGDVCIATSFYSTGHVNPDCTYDIKKMYECKNRKYKPDSR
jgi:hypothetical protein